MWKRQPLFHSPMCTNQPLRVMELGAYGANVTYVVKFPFTEISCCTCEWASQRNMCKHQIVVILTCIDITQKDIIHYCGTRYGSHCGRLGHMFMDPQHIPNYMESNDDNKD